MNDDERSWSRRLSSKTDQIRGHSNGSSLLHPMVASNTTSGYPHPTTENLSRSKDSSRASFRTATNSTSPRSTSMNSSASDYLTSTRPTISRPSILRRTIPNERHLASRNLLELLNRLHAQSPSSTGENFVRKMKENATSEGGDESTPSLQQSGQVSQQLVLQYKAYPLR